jgi:RNA polymerase primary sigma factor
MWVETTPERTDFDSLYKILKTIMPREAHILSERFGLYSEPKTYAEIGLECGVTGNRIRQIEQRALKKLRSPPRLRQLNQQDTSAVIGESA